MRKTILVMVVLQALGAQAAQNDATPAAAAPSEEVKVSGMRDPDFKPYRTMLLGLDAFDKHHGRAPAADLKFVLRPLAPGGDIKGVTLRIAGEESSVAVPVSPEGTFTLVRDPSIEKDAELLTNRKKGSVRWRPLVRSPGVPEGSRRLGDLRLECAVRWAVEKEGMSFVQRNLFAALGACNNKRIFVYYHVDAPLESATLREGGRTRDVARPGATFFSPPLHDESWSDDALVELRYQAAKT
ncbi:MAG TPA: hypothetical protein VFT37_02655 [Telluria sp.]|nr:hypothetical protein [Telluria sp.]